MERRIGIIVNGATGELARRQHLRALVAIRKQGGLRLADGNILMPDPILVGRNAERLKHVSSTTGIPRWSPSLEDALADANNTIFFDTASTQLRSGIVRKAIAAGKHVYCEKPIASSLEDALDLVREAKSAGVKHGTVQDKLFLPGFRKLAYLKDTGYFGRILEVRLEFSRWIFDGEHRPGQRPSWNYRKRDGGGLVLDMFPHWRYMIDRLAGEVRAVNCTTRTHFTRRWDEHGRPYNADAEDAVFAQFELEGGVVASVNSSWCSRTRRDDVVTIQIDGTAGSAVAGPQDCYTQPDGNTPNPVLPVDSRQPVSLFDQWLAMPDNTPVENSYRCGWELFLRHVVEDGPFPSPLDAGAKGVQLVAASYLSSQERRWVDVPSLSL